MPLPPRTRSPAQITTSPPPVTIPTTTSPPSSAAHQISGPNHRSTSPSVPQPHFHLPDPEPSRSRSHLPDCKYLHLRCNAHIINLVVKEGLEEQDQSIRKIRNAIRYLRSSPSRYQSFKESVEKEKIDCKRKPCLDVETRWNSTFLMLKTALKFEKAFARLRNVNFNYRAYFDSEVEDDDDASTRNGKRKRNDRDLGAPNSKDWENARLFVEHLRIFFDATKRVSGTKYVTANLLFGELCQMHTSIAQITLSPDENKKKMAVSMKKKFDKYWDNLANMNPLLYVALILDPRDKMFYLTFCLELIYGEKAKQVDLITAQVKATLVELFDSYKMKFGKPTESTSTSSSSVVNTNGVTNIEEGYMRYLAKKRGSGLNASEVEVYLNDGCETKIIGDNSFDVLGWWKINSVKFPVLSQVARHVLGMPISSVASESAFSMGGRVIDKYRSSLTPKTAEF
ncbi:hypothetical protein SSX86_001422 [Deinandra increscens subsp. villosa]|uniref:Transposase n=1 Tax=Deinandra increscens subsp. villosa TaxID=3103831 RepID=A0AAP0DZ01_9ASTR